MKYLLTILLFSICASGQSQKTTNKDSLVVPQLTFDTNGELIITASTSSSKHDFDFFEGQWKLHNRILKKKPVRNGKNLSLPRKCTLCLTGLAISIIFWLNGMVNLLKA